MSGSKLVFPGPGIDGASLQSLMDAEGVTVTLGVPTVWLNLLNYLDSSGKSLNSVKRIVIGGSAAPPAMIEAFARAGWRLARAGA